jgi:hypothetical protein
MPVPPVTGTAALSPDTRKFFVPAPGSRKDRRPSWTERRLL